MARQSFGGIGRVPVIIWLMKLDETSMRAARADLPPAISAALSMALMVILLVVQENIKCCLGFSQALLRAGGGVIHTNMLTMVNRRELTPHEKSCAARLKALWLVKKEKEKLTQLDAGLSLGMSDSAFNQYINAKIPLNTDMTARMAVYFGVRPREIDPLWLKEGGDNLEAELLDMLNEADSADLMFSLKRVAEKSSPADALKIARFFLDRAAAGS